MTYYTDFKLEFKLPKTDNNFIKELEKKGISVPNNVKIEENTDVLFEKLESVLFDEELFDGWILGDFWTGDADGVSWYMHKKHMQKLSEMFPTVLFTLHGKGERNEDMWQEYYLNGKMQRVEAEIVFAPFDESKLEEING